MRARQRLLARLVAVAVCTITTPACHDPVETHERCYEPGASAWAGEQPPLPCLPQNDSRLPSYLDPGCTQDFAVKSGPTQKTFDNAKVYCCYTTEYDPLGGDCQVGRPLLVRGAPLRAPLVVGGGWGAA